MKIVIIGGGIAGLSTAYYLTKAGHQISLFEKDNVLGGLTSSFKQENWSWPLEKYYHHIFSSDKNVFGLLNDLGIRDCLFFKQPKTSVFIDQKIFPFDTPKSIITFPKLNLYDKLRLSLLTVILKINPFWKPLEKISSYDFIQKTMGKNNFNLIWKPLLDSKFGSNANQIPASWFWTRIQKRSFKLGYLKGGLAVLIDTLSQKIKQNNGKIYLEQEINHIYKTGNNFFLSANNKRVNEEFERIIITTSPNQLPKIIDGLSSQEKSKLTNLDSIGTVCLILELKNSFLTDGSYWLNINDPKFPFVSVVEHTNFIDRKFYGSNSILYVGGYYPVNHSFFKLSSEELIKKILPFLKQINPGFDFSSQIINSWSFKDIYTQPVPHLNYSKNLPSTITSIPGLYWGSLHHIYPQDRGVNYAIDLGKRIANEVMDKKN